MGAIIEFKNKNSDALNTKWDAAEQSFHADGENIAIKMDSDGNVELHHSEGMDNYTLLGLLEVFKSQLAAN